MDDKIRVLNINYDSSEYGGVSVFLINVYRNIDHSKFQIDFLTPDTTSFNPWREEIENLGGSIYEAHINRRRQVRFGRWLRSFLSDHPYDIVHINSGSVSFNCISAVAAKSKDIKVVIHSHNNKRRGWWKNLLAVFMKPRMQKHADVLCACSKEAARNVFTEQVVDQGKVRIINNGIDIQKFCYNPEIRDKIRRELHIEDQFVIGHVGRFEEQKNHDFLIDIFAEIHKKKHSTVLLLIGAGGLEPHIREKVRNLHLENNVIFLGTQKNVEDWYQAMDVFIFPSLFEGLPIVLVEAQESGLSCCISDEISNEVDITNLIHRISLQDSAKEWARKILSIDFELTKRCSHDQELAEAGYSNLVAAEQISQIYISLKNME